LGDVAPGGLVDLGAHARDAPGAGVLDHVEANALGRDAREARLQLLHGGPLGLAEAVALALGGQLGVERRIAHRRRPERFFFLRGERGGALLGPPLPRPDEAEELPPLPPLATAAAAWAGFGAGGFPRAGLSPSPSLGAIGSGFGNSFFTSSCWPI